MSSSVNPPTGVPITYGVPNFSWRIFAAGRPTEDTTRFTSASPAWDKSSDNGEYVRIDAKFSGCTKYITSKVLKRVDISCRYSGMEVYFDSADMAGNEVELNVDVLCGGVELYIPKNWGIKVEADCVLGGIDQPNGAYDEKEKILIIKGRAKIAGIDITYV